MLSKPLSTTLSLGKNTSQYNLFKRYIGATEKRNKNALSNILNPKYIRMPRKSLTIKGR
jgi:hypothetical protein